MRRAFWLPMLVLICSCSLVPVRPKTPEITPGAAARLSEIEALNRGLNAFKGIGTLRLLRPAGLQTVRAAWVAEMPDRLRLELLGPAGTPLASLVADGPRLDVFLHDREKRYRGRSGEDGLEPVIGVGLNAADVVALLGGRILVHDFHQAFLENRLLVLKDDRGRLVETVGPVGGEKDGRVVERFDAEGKPRYRVQLEAFRSVDGFSVPGVVRVFAGGRERVHLSVDRFWANPEVAPSVFVLNLEAPRSGPGP